MKDLSKTNMIDLGKDARRQTRRHKEVTYRRSVDPKSKSVSIAFSIPVDTIKELRWMHGDRVTVLWDKDTQEGQLVRCQHGGWALTKGASAHASYRVALTEKAGWGFPNGDSQIKESITTENTIIFRFK